MVKWLGVVCWVLSKMGIRLQSLGRGEYVAKSHKLGRTCSGLTGIAYIRGEHVLGASMQRSPGHGTIPGSAHGQVRETDG